MASASQERYERVGTQRASGTLRRENATASASRERYGEPRLGNATARVSERYGERSLLEWAFWNLYPSCGVYSLTCRANRMDFEVPCPVGKG